MVVVVGGGAGYQETLIRQPLKCAQSPSKTWGTYVLRVQQVYYRFARRETQTKLFTKNTCTNKLETVVEHPPQAKSLPKGIENKPVLLQN